MADIRSQYIDTAYTLGANRRQIILKVLVPLAMPGVFNSLRLLFGLAFRLHHAGRTGHLRLVGGWDWGISSSWPSDATCCRGSIWCC